MKQTVEDVNKMNVVRNGQNDVVFDEKKYDDILAALTDAVYQCPVCDADFNQKEVVLKSLKVMGSDSDTRMYYEPLDPILYDVIICPNCGYASMAKTFDNISFSGSQLFTALRAPKYKDVYYPPVISYGMAAKRYKAALYTALVTRDRSCEIAYLYMRLAWIYRTLGDNETEKKMMSAAFEGFSEAIHKEHSPFLNMDEATTLYVMGDFLIRLGKESEAKKFFDASLKKGASPKIKRFIKAREQS